MDGIACTNLRAVVAGFSGVASRSPRAKGARPGTPGVPYANMPAIAPIGVRVDNYHDVHDSAKGTTVDPTRRYRTQKLGDGLYMITHNSIQHVLMTYEDSDRLVCAELSLASRI